MNLPSDPFAKLLDRLATTGEDAELEQIATELVGQARPRLRLAVLAILGNRQRGASRMMAYADKIEQQLFTDDRIANASTVELLQMFRLLRESGASDLDSFIQTADMELEPKKRQTRRNRLRDKVRGTLK